MQQRLLALAGALVLALAAILLLPAWGKSTTARNGLPPLTTVDSLDVQRYLGSWYEIASYPQSFQKGCSNTIANYSLRDDGLIKVSNSCTRNGELSEAVGRARVRVPSDTTKLQVSFFGPFWGDYWVIDLGSNYEYAVVGHPGRDYLWILSRTPTLEASVEQGIRARLEAKHYDLSRLVRTDQSGNIK